MWNGINDIYICRIPCKDICIVSPSSSSPRGERERERERGRERERERERERRIENEGAMQAHTYPVMEVVGRLLLRTTGRGGGRRDGMALAILLAQIRKGGTICPPPPSLSVVVTTWTERSWEQKDIISLYGGSRELDIFSFSLVMVLSFHCCMPFGLRLLYRGNIFAYRLYVQQFNSSFPPLLLLFTQLFTPHHHPPTDRPSKFSTKRQRLSPPPPFQYSTMRSVVQQM